MTVSFWRQTAERPLRPHRTTTVGLGARVLLKPHSVTRLQRSGFVTVVLMKDVSVEGHFLLLLWIFARPIIKLQVRAELIVFYSHAALGKSD